MTYSSTPVRRTPPGCASSNSQVGEAPAGQLELPFDTNELATLFRQAVGGTRNVRLATQAASKPIDVQQLGSALYRALFAGPIGDLLRSGKQGAESRGASLRIRLRIDPLLPALADLPWEFLYSPEEHRFLALFDGTPVVRYVEMAKAARPLAGKPPLTILAVISSPSDLPQLKVEQEWARLEKALEGARQHGDIRLERLPGATLDGLLARLDQSPVHILHFIGHGYFDDERNEGGLAFVDDGGRKRLVPAAALTTVTNHQTLRLAFLNACEGATSGRTNSFAGVAQQLVRQGLPAVVAMQFPIGDDAAITLAQAFYGALAEGDPVELALGKARRAVDARSSDFQWGTPVLFSRSDDNRLIELPQGDRAARHRAAPALRAGDRAHPRWTLSDGQRQPQCAAIGKTIGQGRFAGFSHWQGSGDQPAVRRFPARRPAAGAKTRRMAPTATAPGQTRPSGGQRQLAGRVGLLPVAQPGHRPPVPSAYRGGMGEGGKLDRSIVSAIGRSQTPLSVGRRLG